LNNPTGIYFVTYVSALVSPSTVYQTKSWSSTYYIIYSYIRAA